MATAITKTNGAAPAPLDVMAYAGSMTPAQVQLIKATVITGGTRPVTDNELALFLTVCSRRGLDPFAGQVYGIMRKSKQKDGTWTEKLVIQVGIDGYRLLAEQTGKYEGQLGPYWCGADGAWTDIWLSEAPPAAAKVGVLRAGCREPFWGVVTYREFCDKRDGKPIGKWESMPALMLAKVAEAAAIRKAFPQAVGGLTTPETAAADTETDVVTDADRTMARLQDHDRTAKAMRGRQPWREELDDIVDGTVIAHAPAAQVVPAAQAEQPAPAAPTPEDASPAASRSAEIMAAIDAAKTIQALKEIEGCDGWDGDYHLPAMRERIVEMVASVLGKIDWDKVDAGNLGGIEARLATAAIELDPMPPATSGRAEALALLDDVRRRVEAARAGGKERAA